MDKRLIEKFLQRKCTAEEEKSVVEWMHSKDFEAELLSHIEADLLHMETHTVDERDERSLQNLLQNIWIRDHMELIDSEKRIDRVAKPKDKSSHWPLRVAASLVILLVCAYLINFFSRETPVDPPIQPQLVVKENSKGRRSTIVLPDGSIVNLNAASKIEYKENFNDTSRVVYLEGEAFFDVVKDSLRPFVVVAENISVTALGTSFNVASYQEEDRIAIALASGRVVVSEAHYSDKVVLEPGQQVGYQKKHNQFTELHTFSAKSVYGWKDGVLYFKSATLPEVISRLERWFGVEFVIVGNRPPSWSYTGEFDDQSLKSVLESLSFSQNFVYEINQKTVKIEFNSE